MGLFKPDFYRFFVFGFAAGAALVVGMMDGQTRAELASGMVPAAKAAVQSAPDQPAPAR